MSTIEPPEGFEPTKGQIPPDAGPAPAGDHPGAGRRRPGVMFWLGLVDRLLQIILFTLILVTGTPVIAAVLGIVVNVLLGTWCFSIRCRIG